MLKQEWLSTINIFEFKFSTDPVHQSNAPVEEFQWLPKEHMCVLVYLVSAKRTTRDSTKLILLVCKLV